MYRALLLNEVNTVKIWPKEQPSYKPVNRPS